MCFFLLFFVIYHYYKIDHAEYNEFLEFIAAENNRYNNEKDPELSKFFP